MVREPGRVALSVAVQCTSEPPRCPSRSGVRKLLTVPGVHRGTRHTCLTRFAMADTPLRCNGQAFLFFPLLFISHVEWWWPSRRANYNNQYEPMIPQKSTLYSETSRSTNWLAIGGIERGVVLVPQHFSERTLVSKLPDVITPRSRRNSSCPRKRSTYAHIRYITQFPSHLFWTRKCSE